VSREQVRRFHFLKEIASGGFGSVYVAKVMEADGFQRLMAVKLLHQRWSDNLEISKRMKDEARLLGALRHRNIVNVFGFTTIGGRVAVMMEYLEAVDVKVAISALAERNERMPVRAALELIASTASALDAAWNQPPFPGEKPLRVIHRDIKPSNVMLDDSGTVKVLDFGVARAEFDHRESHTQELQFGSVDYMPPERLFFEPETDRSDVYSLGATLFEIVTGDRLGKAKGRAEKHEQALEERLTLLRVVPEESREPLAALLREMLAYAAESRPSAAEVVQRCRVIARTSQTDGLAEWSEREIPALVNLARTQMRDPNPLTDSILLEDAGSAMRDSTDALPVPDTEEVAARREASDVTDDPDGPTLTGVAAPALADVLGAAAAGAVAPPSPAVVPGSPRPTVPSAASGVGTAAPPRTAAAGATPRWVVPLLVASVLVVLVAAVAVGLRVRGQSASAPELTAAAPVPAPPTAGAAALVRPIRVVTPLVVKRFRLECDGRVAESAVSEVAVGGPRATSCTVTAVLPDRSRRVARVEGATEGRYTCFGGADNTCVR
jgi:serine/threonine-protein kinase